MSKLVVPFYSGEAHSIVPSVNPEFPPLVSEDCRFPLQNITLTCHSSLFCPCQGPSFPSTQTAVTTQRGPPLAKTEMLSRPRGMQARDLVARQQGT